MFPIHMTVHRRQRFLQYHYYEYIARNAKVFHFEFAAIFSCAADF